MRPLERALDVQFKVLDEKDGTGKECTATLIELSSHRALLRTEESMQPLDNLKIVLEDGSGAVIAQEIYAKVVPTQAPISGTYLLQFTSIPQEAEDFFKSVLQELTKLKREVYYLPKRFKTLRVICATGLTSR